MRPPYLSRSLTPFMEEADEFCLYHFDRKNFGPIFIFFIFIVFYRFINTKKYFHLNVKEHVSDPLGNEEGGKTLYFLKTT